MALNPEKMAQEALKVGRQAGPVAKQMPLELKLRVLADHIKRNNGLRDNAAKDHRTLIEAADALAAQSSPLAGQDKEDAELLLLIERLEDASSKALTQAHNAGKVAHKAGIYMPSIEAGAELARAIIALRDFAARAKKEPTHEQ